MYPTKVDNIYIVNSDGLRKKCFHICDKEKAEKELKEMRNYHLREYNLIIVNEYKWKGYGFQAKSSEEAKKIIDKLEKG